MRILLSLLLIPFVVLGQSLPHSHAGSGIVEPSDHAARPHVHLFGGHSHHHHHDEDTQTEGGVAYFSASLDHDSDAIYLAQSSSTIARVSANASVDTTTAPSFMDYWACQPVGFSAPSHGVAHHRYDGLSIYLLVNSFRL